MFNVYYYLAGTWLLYDDVLAGLQGIPQELCEAEPLTEPMQ